MYAVKDRAAHCSNVLGSSVESGRNGCQVGSRSFLALGDLPWCVGLLRGGGVVNRTVADKVGREVVKGVHPLHILARFSLDSRQLAQIVAELAGVHVPAYRLPVSGQGVRHHLQRFVDMGHVRLPSGR